MGVHPPQELARRPRLFTALEGALPVTFEAASASVAAVIVLADVAGAPAVDGRRRYEADERAGGSTGARAAVRFAGSELLDSRLRRRVLGVSAPPGRLAAQPGDRVLADIDGAPVWIRRAARDVVAAAPDELGPGEFLRDRLDPGRFLGLLPLVHFLREVAAAAAWTPPKLRACFVVDDANLHWRSYGHMRYQDLVAHARRHRYHLAVAMVPIDGWFAHGPTVRLFAGCRDVLSLCIHGNDHRMDELGRLGSVEEARPVLAQAARRIAALERRRGLEVSRVVVSPFESCSAASAQAMFELGFDALSHTRPYPWTPWGRGESPHASPDAEHLLSGWWPAELIAGGLPVVVRRELHEHDEIVLRAFLDQPIVLYGHVEDIGTGFEPLAAAAAAVNSLGDVRWGPLAGISESNVALRRDGDVLAVRSFGRRVRIGVDGHAAALRFDGDPPARVRIAGADAPLRTDGSVALPEARPGPLEVEAVWSARHELEAASVEQPAFTAYPHLRRLLAEARDRLEPMGRKLRASAPRRG